jgi:hypothetical protein
MPKEPKVPSREVDQQIIKLKPHPATPQIVLDQLAIMKEEAKQRMEIRRLEVESLGVEVQYNIAKWTKDVSENTTKPKQMNGAEDGRDGRQYLLENAANLKSAAATMALYATGHDPEANNINVAILGRVKSGPIKADDMDVDVVVDRVVE